MTAHAMAGEWPAEFKWSEAAGKRHRRKHRHRADRENLAWRLMAEHGRGRGYRPDPEDIERLAALRHVRGGPFGGGPFGGRGPRRRRRGDVRAALLMLLAEEPMNGYRLMQTIEERSGGEWRPSPGSVYPSLSQLEDEGFVRATERDGARMFEITDAGREHIAERHDERAPWDLSDQGDEHPARQLRPLIGAIAAAAMQVGRAGDDQQVAKAVELLKEVRRGLYRILAEDDDE
jgi:DNA-binding PadR family transcriptional regulator